MSALVAVAMFSATCFAGGLVLVARGTRHLPPLRGACISVPTTALLMLAASPFVLRTDLFDARGAAVFAALGCLFPAAVTLLTFEASRRIGPALTGALGNVSPLFALVFAVIVLGEVPGLSAVLAALVIVAGVVLLFTGRGGWVWPGAAVGSMYVALSMGPVAVVAPLIATYPVIVLALTLPLLGRAALSWSMAAGVALTVAGVALLLAG